MMISNFSPWNSSVPLGTWYPRFLRGQPASWGTPSMWPEPLWRVAAAPSWGQLSLSAPGSDLPGTVCSLAGLGCCCHRPGGCWSWLHSAPSLARVSVGAPGRHLHANPWAHPGWGLLAVPHSERTGQGPVSSWAGGQFAWLHRAASGFKVQLPVCPLPCPPPP